MIESFDIPDLLPRLVDRSLVSYDEATGRYSLLETVRQYAAEHSVNQEDSGALRDKHLEYYIEFTQDFRAKVRGANQVAWLARADEEYDNIRLALDWGLSSDQYFNECVKMMYRINDYWQVRGTFHEVQVVLDRIAAHPRYLEPQNLARHALIQSSVRYFQGGPEHDFKSDLELAGKLDDPILYGDALCITMLGLLRSRRFEEASKLQQPALKALADVGDTVMSAFVHINAGNAATAAGRFEEAEEHYQRCYELRKQGRDLRGVGAALCSLAYVEEQRGNIDRAIELFRRGNGVLCVVGSGWDVGGGLPAQCLELTRDGRYEDAARILGYSESLLTRVGGERDNVDGPSYKRWVETVRAHLGKETFDKRFKEGMQMSTQSIYALVFPAGLEVDVFGDGE